MIIVITGPTAVGKTKLSIELAKKYNGEIINADSTQIFKDLDIATAKVTKDEMENIQHHLIDIKNIDENYTVFDYQKDCRKKIDEILKNNKTPIIVGGTGLYIKAALYDYQFQVEEINNDYNNLTNEAIYEKIKLLDSDIDIHINNRKRLVRSLNMLENKSSNINKKGGNKLLYNAIFIGLTTDRKILYDRIDNRVEDMIDNGLLQEATKIYNKKVYTKAVMTPIGYKELFEYFNGNSTWEEAIRIIKQRSRNYAKKQYTWFNNKMNIKWFDVNFDNFSNTILEIEKYIEGENL